MFLIFIDGKLVDPLRYRVAVNHPGVQGGPRITVRFEPGTIEEFGAFIPRRCRVLYLPRGAQWLGELGDAEGDVRFEAGDGRKL
jgi:hypothetical protein